jgi:hypothetical protein
MSKILRQKIKEQNKKRALVNREWYSLRSLIGNDWAIFYFLLGGREIGKSYRTTAFYVNQYRKYSRPFYWLRLTADSARKLLKNNAEKLIDADIRRKFNINRLEVIGESVYEVTKETKDGRIAEKKLMARVLALSTFYADKGNAYFDNEFLNNPDMYYNICLDEMNREKGEKNSFDIVYSFCNQLENLVRSTKKKIRVICIGNTLDEASDLLAAFDFIPEEFGRFYLKSKRAVVDYIEPTEAYLERRKGTIADILMPTASTFTNKIEADTSLILKKRLVRPQYIIKFWKNEELYTVWNDNIIRTYNGEKCPVHAMRPYLDELFVPECRDAVIAQFDARNFKFYTLIEYKKFKKSLELLRPRK